MTPSDSQKLISPRSALEQVASAIPDGCRENIIIIIGSVAAVYHFFGDNAALQVRTKDADCLISPYIRALPAGVAVVERLIDAGWEYHPTPEFPSRGDEKTPDNKLPVAKACDSFWSAAFADTGELRLRRPTAPGKSRGAISPLLFNPAFRLNLAAA